MAWGLIKILGIKGVLLLSTFSLNFSCGLATFLAWRRRNISERPPEPEPWGGNENPVYHSIAQPKKCHPHPEWKNLSNLAIPAGHDNFWRLEPRRHDGLLGPVHAIGLIEQYPLEITRHLSAGSTKNPPPHSQCPLNSMTRAYHSFQDGVVGVHHEVKPVLLSSQVVLIHHVRSAAMVLHYLTHADAQTQRQPWLTATSRSYSKCTFIRLILQYRNSRHHHHQIHRACCLLYCNNLHICAIWPLIWKFVCMHWCKWDNLRGESKILRLTSVRGYLPGFHRIPGTPRNCDKNHIHLQLGANRQMLLWQIPRRPIHTEEERRVKVSQR